MKQFVSTLLVAVCALLAPAAIAQTTSQLTGSVSDKTGAGVPGAVINASNLATAVERSAATNEDGKFNLPFLAPGEYRVTVTKTGFSSAVRENLRLEVNQTLDLDFSLEVGQVSEKLTVTGSLPQLEAASSSIGQVIETKAIEDLPLNGRNFVQLAILGPGVIGVGFGAKGTIMSGTRPDDLRPGSELFANGNREGSNNFLMDGIDNNDRLTLSHHAAALGGERARVQDPDQHVLGRPGAQLRRDGERDDARAAPMTGTARPTSSCATTRWTPGTSSPARAPKSPLSARTSSAPASAVR